MFKEEIEANRQVDRMLDAVTVHVQNLEQLKGECQFGEMFEEQMDWSVMDKQLERMNDLDKRMLNIREAFNVYIKCHSYQQGRAADPQS